MIRVANGNIYVNNNAPVSLAEYLTARPGATFLGDPDEIYFDVSKKYLIEQARQKPLTDDILNELTWLESNSQATVDSIYDDRARAERYIQLNIVEARNTISADDLDTLTLELQLSSGSLVNLTHEFVSEQVNLIVSLGSEIVELTTNAVGYAQVSFTAVYPGIYTLQVNNYESDSLTIVAS